MYGWSRRERSAAVLAAGLLSAVGGMVAAPAAAFGSSASAKWAWPVRGSVITPYSNDNSRPYAGGMHRGIDISASVGASVVAAQAGTVTYAGVLGSSGVTVAIHAVDARYATSYLHLRSVAVKRGESVQKGEKIGEAGTSGRRSAAQPHLHFGVRLTGRESFYVDPLTLLPPPAGGSPAAPPVPAPAPVPVQLQEAPVRVRPAPARARPVPVASLPRPHSAPAPRRIPDSSRVPALSPAPESLQDPVNWGPPVSLAGVLLLGVVLLRRFLRHEGSGRRSLRDERSGPTRGEHRAQPATRTSAGVSPLRSISDVS